MRFVLIMMLLGCGPRNSGMVEIPPLDEETRTLVESPEPVEEAIERDDLGVISFVEMRSETPVVTIRVAFDAGSAEDPRSMAGLTRLAAKLMVEGGSGDKTFTELTEALYPMAGEIDVHTGRDQTVFVGRVHRDHLMEFYGLFRDVLLRPRFDAADFERVRSRTLSALTLGLRGNDDEELGKQTLQSMLYEGHPYGRPALGTESGLAAVTREAAMAQAKRMFCAGRAMVGLAGGYPEDFVGRVVTDLSQRNSDTCVGRRTLPALDLNGPRIWLVEKAEAQSVAVSMGVPIGVTRDHPDYPAITLAVAYLGQHRTFAGRLMQKIRGDRGINYGDYAYAEHFDQAGWTRFPLPNTARRQQYFSAWLRPVQSDQVHFAIRLALRELRGFVSEGLSEDDFQRIRTFVDRYYALYLQTESRRLGFALDDRFYDMPDPWLETLRSRWASLTRDEVNAAVRRHIRLDDLQVAIVTANAAALADALAAETPSPFTHRGTVSEEIRAEDAEVATYRIGVPRDRMHIVPVTHLFR